jgi:hypothetical protein
LISSNHNSGADEVVFAEHLDQVLKLGTVAVERLGSATLIEVAEIEVVVGIVARGASFRAFAYGG